MLRHDSSGTPGCGCEGTLNYNCDRGGAHACRVLASHLTDVRYFTKRDWLLHMNEEEIILGRDVRAGRFPAADYRRILNEHAIIRRMLARYGRVDEAFAKRHAQFEDRALERAGLIAA